MVPVFNPQENAALFSLAIQLIEAEEDAFQVRISLFPSFRQLTFEEMASRGTFQSVIVKQIFQPLNFRFHVNLAQMQHYRCRTQFLCTFDGTGSHSDG